MAIVVVVALRTGLLDERVVGVGVGKVGVGCEGREWRLGAVERRVRVGVWMSMPEMEKRLSWEVERWRLCGLCVPRREYGSSVLGSEALSGKFERSFFSRIRPYLDPGPMGVSWLECCNVAVDFPWMVQEPRALSWNAAGVERLRREVSLRRFLFLTNNTGDSGKLLSGLVGLDESMVISLRSKIVSRKADCGELGTDEGAKEDIVLSDCLDQWFTDVGRVHEGTVTEVCEIIVAAAEVGV